MQGDFDFLDGIIFLNGCDHTRRMYDNWRYADLKPDFKYMFIAPHVINETAEKRFGDEIDQLIKAIEKDFDVKITENKLKESVKLYNKKRDLLSELYERRKQKEVPISGSEVLDLMLAITAMPVEDAISILESLLREIDGRVVSSNNDLRIFLSSGCIEEAEHIELIENSGAIVVADNLCLGARHFDTPVDESAEPIQGLAKRYLGHISCPRMMNDFQRRLDDLHKKREEYSIDAVIAEKLKFCDIWGGEMFIMRKESKKADFPILALERELYGGGTGQIRTRVQAFFEQIKNKKDISDDLVRTAGSNYRAPKN